MKRKEVLPELLAPAGNFEALLAAIEAGADAVYLGGKSFGARAFAENFDLELLKKAVEYAHLNGVKLFVTVNTLVYDREFDSLSDYIKDLYEIGVDAIICADLGVAAEIKRRTPNMPIHASTQMSLNNAIGADMAYELGCERVVLARELSLEDIKSAVENSKAEIEVFLHGALCVCHSGQCLFSSMVGGRSGNRGECAQPCRLPYNNGKYPLSLCDLSLANHVKELIESGVSSLKIEGRMKSPSYVYNVTSIYRRLLDEYRDINAREEELLKNTFSRGGFTDGYFIGKKSGKMTGVRTDTDKAKTKELGERAFSPKPVSLFAVASIKSGEPARLTLKIKGSDKEATVIGQVPQIANSSPLVTDEVKARLSKMGGTYFTLEKEDIELELGENLNLAPSSINALRREGVATLSNFKRDFTDKPFVLEKRKKSSQKLHTGLFLNPKTYEKYRNKEKFFDICYLPIEYFSNAEAIESDVGIYLPPVAFDSELEAVSELLKKAKDKGVKYALCTNLSGIYLCKKYGFEPMGDFRLNISNSVSSAALEKMGVEKQILHPEITLPMARDIGGGVIVYGRIPLMLTERCFIKENYGCDSCNRASLKDRTGADFPLMYEFGHRNLILNSQITYMGDKKEELDRAKIYHRHFIFSTEHESDISRVISSYKKGESLGKNVKIRRIGIK